MAQFIFEGRGKDQRTMHEKIARSNIYHAYNWIVGGYENDVSDGNIEQMPSRAELAEEIYNSALNNSYLEGMMTVNGARREMRFAGEKFCRAYIDWKLDKDGIH